MDDAIQLAQEALKGGESAEKILNEGLIQAMDRIGGAPVTERFAKEIGADGYAPDAASAVSLVKSLMER